MKRKAKDAETGERRTVTYGYVGRWNDGTLGWFLPSHATGVNGDNDAPSEYALEMSTPGDRFVLCRIQIDQVFDARGREITRRGGQKS